MSGGEGVFGKILTLNSKSATIVFIAVLVFFLLFESVLHVFEVACNKRGFKGLVKKLYREFMIMGFISFAIYIASEAYNFPDDEWFSAFHFAHIVIVFIGITFLLQAVLLVSLVSSRNLALLRHANSTSEELILDYVAMHKAGGLRMWLFDHGPISIPFPELREKIEYKILQQFFIKVYNLPQEFKFANYMCMVLKNYVIALVEVRPISWLIMTAFVALNYLKISVIDPLYQHEVCKRYPGADLISEHTFRITGEGSGTADPHATDSSADGEHVCDEYTLRYTFVVLMMIGLYLVGVLIASEVYMKRLIEIVLDQQALDDEAAAAAVTEENTLANAGVSRSSLVNHVGTSGKHTRRGSHISIGGGRRATLQIDTSGPMVGDIEMARQYSGSEVPSSEDKTPPPSGNGESGESDNNNDGELFMRPSTLLRQSSYGDLEQQVPGIKDRRNRYLDGLERLMAIEYNHHMELARRMSTSEGDFMNHEAMAAAAAAHVGAMHAAAATAAAAAGGGGGSGSATPRQHRSLTQSGKTGSFLQAFSLTGGSQQGPPLEHQKSVGHSSAPHRGSNSSVDRPPTGEELRAKFQRMQTIGKELQEMRQREESSSPGGSFHTTRMRSPTSAVAAAPPTRGRSRSGSKFFFIPLTPARDRHGSVGSEETPTKTAAAAVRARGYSVQYFDMNASTTAVAPPYLTSEQPQDIISKLTRVLQCIGALLHKGAKKFGSMLVEHHIGKSKQDVSNDEDVKQLQKQFNLIFLFAQPEFYYHSVEMALLMQCVYIALWATNFVSMAQGSHFPARWQILLVLPLPLNFFLLKQIIFTSCMLKSILSLDKYISDKICEDAVDEQNVTQRLRKLVRIELKKTVPEFDKETAKAYLKDKFEQFCNFKQNGIVGVNEKHMKLYLHSLQIFLTDLSIRRIFAVIDFDRDGIVTWENLCRIVFPDLQHKKVRLKKRTSLRDVKRMSFDIENVENYRASFNQAHLLDSLHPDLKAATAGIKSGHHHHQPHNHQQQLNESGNNTVGAEEETPTDTGHVSRGSLLSGKKSISKHSSFRSTGSSKSPSPVPSLQKMDTTESLQTAVTAAPSHHGGVGGGGGDVLYMTEQEEAARYGALDAAAAAEDGDDASSVSDGDSDGDSGSSDGSEYNTNGKEYIGSQLVVETDEDLYDSDGSLRDEVEEEVLELEAARERSRTLREYQRINAAALAVRGASPSTPSASGRHRSQTTAVRFREPGSSDNEEEKQQHHHSEVHTSDIHVGFASSAASAGAGSNSSSSGVSSGISAPLGTPPAPSGRSFYDV